MFAFDNTPLFQSRVIPSEKDKAGRNSPIATSMISPKRDSTMDHFKNW